MVDGRGNSGGTGGGGGEGAGGASQAWVESNFVSIAYFTRLIKAYGPGASASDPDVEVVPNDVDSTITSIKAMFGLWTEQFISALGQGTGGSGSATSLADLVDVQINTSTLAQGQALLYDGNGHWYNGTVSQGTDMTTVWSALAAATNEQINASHLSTALTGYATQTWVGQQGFATQTWVGQQGFATQTWVGQNYLSIAFFARLFQAKNGNTNVNPNDTTSTIDSIKAMFGFWTDQYISALGQGSGGSGGGALADLVDVTITNPQTNQALIYNGNGHWVNANIPSGIDMSTVWSALAAATNEQINASHLSTALSDYVTSSAISDMATKTWVGQQDYITSSGSCNYATSAGSADSAIWADKVYCTSHIGSWYLSSDYDGSDYFWLTAKYGSNTLPCAVDYATSAGSAGSSGSATQLSNARTLWGQSFNGTANVSGSMYGVGDIQCSSGSRIYPDGAGMLYIGSSSNVGWVMMQDICSQDSQGDGIWSIRTNGIARFQNVYMPDGGRISCNNASSSQLYIGNENDSGWVRISDMCSRQGDSYWKVLSNGSATFANVLSNGYVTALSDVRLKKVLGHVELTAEQIAKASAIRFSWKDGHDKREHVGGIAQEWKELLPQAVVDVDGRLSMDYSAIAYVSVVSLAKKVVAQQREIDSLKAENAKLEKRLERLEKMFAITGEEDE